MLFGMTMYQLMWYFFCYSFLGWIVEVIFQGVYAKKILNRGFLNGPICPIYGAGMILILGNLTDLLGIDIEYVNKVDWWIIFFGAIVFSTIVELVAGWLLHKLFKIRWWDYTTDPLNIGGYVCLPFSAAWGVGAIIVIKLVQPVVYKLVEIIPVGPGNIILLVMVISTVADIIITVMTLVGLNKKLRELDELKKSMRIVSDNLSEVIGESSIITTQILEEGAIKTKDVITKSATKTRDTIANKASSNKAVLTEIANKASGNKAMLKEIANKASSNKAVLTEIAKKTSLKVSENPINNLKIKSELKKFMNARKYFEINRIVRAFPNLKNSTRLDVILELLDEYKKKNKKK